MKEKFMRVGKIVSGVVCTAIGLAIAGFGVTQFIPSKKYISGDIPHSGRYPWGNEDTPAETAKEDEPFFDFESAKQISD